MTKKLIVYASLLIALVGSVQLGLGRIDVSQQNSDWGGAVATGTYYTVEEPRRNFNPVRLQIPKIGIDVFVELVGKDEKGNMDVPVADVNAGWYKYGTTPGFQGRAVITGHVDTETGPSIFAELSELEPGDTIYVSNIKGETHEFRVFDKEVYKNDTFPVSKVFGKDSNSYLNLITCTGIFDRGVSSYTDRLVVFSRLVVK